MMNAVMQMAEIFIDLCRSGCTLFYNWLATFYCRVDISKQNVLFQFEKDSEDTEHVPPITGCTNNVIKEMNETSQFLEKFLLDWKTHVNSQRTRHYYLNYFTTEQLVILQRELAKLNLSGKLDKRVFHLLHCIRPDSNADDLSDAIKSAFVEGIKDDDDVNEQRARDIDDIISAVEKSGIDRSLALKAILHGQLNKQDGTYNFLVNVSTLWGIKH